MENFSDSNLIKKHFRGDEKAFAALISRHLGLVYKISLYYLRNRADAEDATQEIFVKVWKNLKSFDQKRKFSTWLSEIAKNTCLDILKQKRVIPFSAFENEDGNNYIIDDIKSQSLMPADFAEQSLSAKWVGSILDKLSPIYQKVIKMYYFEGLNFREISKNLGEPLHTVKSRHRRAIIKLKGFLKN